MSEVTRQQLDDAVDAFRDACWDWARAPHLTNATMATLDATQEKYDAARKHLHALLDQVVPR